MVMLSTRNPTQRAVSPTCKNQTPYLLFYMRADAVANDASAAAAAIASIPPALRAEVEADNRLARSAGITSSSAPVFGGRPGSGGGGVGEGGGVGGGEIGPSWGVA